MLCTDEIFQIVGGRDGFDRLMSAMKSVFAARLGQGSITVPMLEVLEQLGKQTDGGAATPAEVSQD